MEATTNIILTLDEAAETSPAEVGHKAWNLAVLRRAGFPVPDGVVITASAFVDFTARQGFGPSTLPADVRRAALPSEVSAALRRACRTVGWPVAVRSSGVAEDLPGASFAGQYESVLDVRNETEAEAALLRCWGSTFSAHVSHYRSGAAAPMAVLVQRMVAADAAGVAFTANPVSGTRDEVAVDAVRGLADRLVSGEVNAEHWLVRAGVAHRLAGVQDGRPPVITPGEAESVARLAQRIERHFGAPQDVEWALSTGGLFVVQARPITGLPDAPAHGATVPDGFWEREVSHAPRPHSPMSASFFFRCVTDGLRAGMAEFGLLVDTIEYRDIEGWTYARLVPLGGKDRPAPPRWMMPLLIRLVPGIRRRVRRCIAAERSHLAESIVERWYAEWQPSLWRRSSAIRAIDPGSLSDSGLERHLLDMRDFVIESTRIHFLLHVTIAVPLADFAFASRELLGWDDVQVWELLSGLSAMTTEPVRQLAELARIIGRRPDLVAIVQAGGAEAPLALRRSAPDVADALDHYLQDYGLRTLTYDVADGSLAESPGLFMRLIADQLSRGFEPTVNDRARSDLRVERLEEARTALAGRCEGDQRRWEAARERAARAYPIRDGNGFYTVSGPLALVRRAALEVGRRLSDRGQATAVDDCFFLGVDEAVAALQDGRDRVEVVARRRARRLETEAHPGPATYGTPPPPPAVDALPPDARPAHRALLWYPQQVMEAGLQGSEDGATLIRGMPASGGRHLGPCRVVLDERDFGKLHPGDVLVCPMTSPVWSILFPTVGAVVTDSGGLLSHPAIIAREFGVPAVVATGDATRRLRDGQLVEVDGSAGTVEFR